MKKDRGWLLCACLLPLIGTASVAAAAEPALCAALRGVSEAHGRVGQVLETMDLTAADDATWNLRIPNVDLDGDDVGDSILLYRGASPSRFPSDPMRARLTLSATGQSYTAEYPHIAFRRFRSQIFLVGLTYAEQGGSTRLDVQRVDRHGLSPACSVTVSSP